MTFDVFSITGIVVLIALAITAYRCIYIVQEKDVYIVERLGRFLRKMDGGFHIIVPFIDRVAYKLTTKEEAIDLSDQTAITSDNISLRLNGVLYLKVLDAEKAAYGVDNYLYAVENMAQTTMRSAIGEITLDESFKKREELNSKIVTAINAAASTWGVQVMRYEILDLVPPESLLQAMEKQVQAEREKRAAIEKSQGDRESAINRAEGQKRADILQAEGKKAAVELAAEAAKTQTVLEAEAQAKSIALVAEAQADALKKIAEVTSTPTGQTAVQLELAKKALEARLSMGKHGTIIMTDQNQSSVGSMVAEALAVTTAVNQATNQ